MSANLTIGQAHLDGNGEPGDALLRGAAAAVVGDIPVGSSMATPRAWSPATADLTTTATAASGVGDYPITAGLGTLAAVNYDFTAFVGSTLTVTKAHLTVTANSASITYGTPLPALDATISGFVAGDSATVVTGAPSLSTTANDSSGAGAYPVTVGLGTLAAANYDFPNLVGGTLTVTKAHLSVSAGAVSITYGDPIPPLSAAISGFVRGDTASVVSGTPALSTTATSSSGVGRLSDRRRRGDAGGVELRLHRPRGKQPDGRPRPT